MSPEMLTHHRVFATTDLDAARAAVAERFCPHRLALTRRDGHLDLVHNVAAINDDVALHFMGYGAEVHITPGTFDDFFLVQLPVTGTARVRVGQREVASTPSCASVGSPTEPVDMLWSEGCMKLVVQLARSAVEEFAAGDDTSEKVIFEPALRLDSPAARDWIQLIRLLVNQIEAGGTMYRSPLVSQSIAQTLVAGLLSIQPNSSHACPPPPPAGSRAVRDALTLIEERPEHAWRVAELAAAVGVSARSLQEVFRRELDVTPLEQLRHVRLERARTDLLVGDPGRTSVTDIATKWGFFHLGRFSSAYRRRFAELPSQTLAQ